MSDERAGVGTEHDSCTLDAPTTTIAVVLAVAREAYSFEADIWIADSGSWHFLSLPEHVTDDIDARHGERSGGFGSVRVEVTIGSTNWATSIFPDRKRGTYVLPVKKAVRVAERLTGGATALVKLVVVAADGGTPVGSSG